MITFSKFLATIKIDVPIQLEMDALVREEADENSLRSIFEELEFRTLIDRVLKKDISGNGITSATAVSYTHLDVYKRQLSYLTIMNTEPESRANEYLKGIVANLPEKPGIYQYLNTEGTIIYVGKAKNLKKRVYSYFSKEHEPGKTRGLVLSLIHI